MSAVLQINQEKLNEAFPVVDPGFVPFGYRVLVQLRTPKLKSAGGIILDPGTKETEKWNIQVGKVIAIAPGAFKNRDTMEVWPEGAWCKVGDFVRIPKYGADRWSVPIPGKRNRDDEEFAMFVVIKDLDIIGAVTCDPLSVIAYL